MTPRRIQRHRTEGRRRHPLRWLVGIVAVAVLVMCGTATTATTPTTPPPEPSVPLYESTDEPPTLDPTTPAPTKARPNPAPTGAVTVYGSCAEARRAGDAPLHRGDPGYSRELDRDGDGVACE